MRNRVLAAVAIALVTMGATYNALRITGTLYTDDSVLVGNGTDYQVKTISDCDDTGGNHLNYDTGTNVFSCGTSSSGGATTTGTFTATQTGCSAGSTGTLAYIKDANIVTLHASGGGAINCTSNANTHTFTGLPAAIRPSVSGSGSVAVPGFCLDNAAIVHCRAVIDSTGVITFGVGSGFSSTGWTASGTKGINNAWSITYHTDTTNP